MLNLDLFSGELFVFISKRGDRVKILTWERGGLALWYKRLERGTFKRVKGSGILQLDEALKERIKSSPLLHADELYIRSSLRVRVLSIFKKRAPPRSLRSRLEIKII